MDAKEAHTAHVIKKKKLVQLAPIISLSTPHVSNYMKEILSSALELMQISTS